MIQHDSLDRRSKLNTRSHFTAPLVRRNIRNGLSKRPTMATQIFGCIVPLTEWIRFGFTNNLRAVSPGEFAVLIDVLNTQHHGMTPMRLLRTAAANGNQRRITKHKLVTMV